MGSIVSRLGGGSGIDMVQLANDLANAQFAQRGDRLNSRSETLERRISAASTIRNGLSLLASSLGDRVRVGDLSPKPTVGNAAVATASTPVGTRGSGSYSLEVTQLAASQTLASPVYASSNSVVGEGTLSFRFGAVAGSSFTEDTSHAALDIAVSADDTLTTLAQKITASGKGITAYVATTAAGAQLVFKGQDGATNGFVVSGTGASQSGNPTAPGNIDHLDWRAGADPSRLSQGANDAVYKLDGIERTSASNDLGQVAPGLALKLASTNVGSPTQITFADPSGSIQTAMQDLVTALNEITGELRQATSPIGGDLASDPGARALKQQLSRLAGVEVMPTAPQGAPRTLSELGLTIQRDGSFTLDTERLSQTMQRDPQGVAAMFTNGLHGVYSTFDKLSRNMSRSSDGNSLAGSIARYERQSESITADLSEIAEKQETLRQQLVSRFAKADVRIASSQSTLTFLKSQIDIWNSSSR